MSWVVHKAEPVLRPFGIGRYNVRVEIKRRNNQTKLHAVYVLFRKTARHSFTVSHAV